MTQEERTEFFADAFFGTGPETEGIRRKIRDVAGEAPEDLRPDVLRSLAKEVSRLFEPDDRPGRMSSAQRACKDFELLMDQMMEQAMRGGPYTVAIDVAAAEKSQTSLLGKCSRKDLENYCKYLGIGLLNGLESGSCTSALRLPAERCRLYRARRVRRCSSRCRSQDDGSPHPRHHEIRRCLR